MMGSSSVVGGIGPNGSHPRPTDRPIHAWSLGNYHQSSSPHIHRLARRLRSFISGGLTWSGASRTQTGKVGGEGERLSLSRVITLVLRQPGAHHRGPFLIPVRFQFVKW